MVPRICAVLSLLALPSCTAGLDLDRFKTADAKLDAATSTNKFVDLRFNAKSMQSHINEYLEIRIVDKDNGIAAKAVYFGITDTDFSLTMRNVVPKLKPPYRIDFWADHNNSGKYDGIEGGINDKDHAWRRILVDPLPEDVKLTDRYTLDFLHDTSFVDTFTDLAGNKIDGKDTLLNLNLRVIGAAYAGKMVEIRVVDKASGRLVALHRRGRADEIYTAQVLGVLDEETTYEVSAYADTNGDKKYSAGDPSWKIDLVSTTKGLDGDLNLETLPQSPIETGE